MIQADPAAPRPGDRPPDLVVTYCSREKDPSAGLMPASARYRSPRIHNACAAAQLVGAEFYILSGRFGLIPADREIPDYDHVLTAAAVAGHADVLVRELRRHRTRRVVFIVRAVAFDPGARPYLQAMRLACDRCGVAFTVLEINEETPAPGELAAMIDRRDRSDAANGVELDGP